MQTHIEPILREIIVTAAPRKVQQLLDGLLGTLCSAFGAVLELPGRKFAPEHEPIMRADLDALCGVFLGKNLLEREMILYSVQVLYSLVNAACDS